MVTIGETIEINGELYEKVRTLRLGYEVVLTSEEVESARLHYRADKIFKREGIYYFVNLIPQVEFEMIENNGTAN